MLTNQKISKGVIANSGEAIIAIDLKGNVIFWNKGAENLFGYNRKEVIGNFAPFITTHSLHELEHLVKKAKAYEKSCFRTCKRNKNGAELNLIFVGNPLIYKNSVMGISIAVKDAKQMRNAGYLPLDVNISEREQKRTFIDIRKLILSVLYNGKKTINQIANDSDINWRTVEKHLTYLLGKKLVEEVSSSKYLRVFELTIQGEVCIKKFRKEEIEKYVKS